MELELFKAGFEDFVYSFQSGFVAFGVNTAISRTIFISCSIFPKCNKATLERANELFKAHLKKLKFHYYLKNTESPKVEYTKLHNGFELLLYIDFENYYQLGKYKDWISLSIKEKGKDKFWLYDKDFSAGNGVDIVKNCISDEYCSRDGNIFDKFTLKKANKIFKKYLKKLKFHYFLKKRNNSPKPHILDGWK